VECERTTRRTAVIERFQSYIDKNTSPPFFQYSINEKKEDVYEDFQFTGISILVYDFCVEGYVMYKMNVTVRRLREK
jgi:hypothetical protein